MLKIEQNILARMRCALACHFYSQVFFTLLQLARQLADLRDDKQFFADHPGAAPITTSQVS